MSVFKKFVMLGDSRIVELADLITARLPKHLHERALWEEKFTPQKPVVPGGQTEFKGLHAIRFDGETPDGDPDNIRVRHPRGRVACGPISARREYR